MACTFKLGSCFGVVGSVSKPPEAKTTKNGKVYCNFSVYAGKYEDGTSHYVNCRAWQPVAGLCMDLAKGDPIMCVGRMDENEYNGKTYKTLVLDWFGSPAISADVVVRESDQGGSTNNSGFREVDDDGDVELPF